MIPIQSIHYKYEEVHLGARSFALQLQLKGLSSVESDALGIFRSQRTQLSVLTLELNARFCITVDEGEKLVLCVDRSHLRALIVPVDSK